MPTTSLLPPPLTSWGSRRELTREFGNTLSTRSQLVAQVKSTGGGWMDAAGGRLASLGSLTGEAFYHFGSFLVPPPGNSTGAVTLWFRIDDFITGGIDFAAEVEGFGTDFLGNITKPRYSEDTVTEARNIMLTAPDALKVTPTADGWYSLALTLRTDRASRVTFAAQGAAGSSMRLRSVCILADVSDSYPDGQAVPDSFPVCSTQWMRQTDYPASAHILKSIVGAQSYVLDRRPKVLASHAFSSPDSTATTVAVPETYTYRIRRGPETQPVTFRIYAKTSNASGAGALSVKINGTSQDVYVSGVSHSSASVTSASGAWHTFEVRDGWTANDLNDIEISAAGSVYTVSMVDHVSTVHVFDITATENALDPADFVVTDGDRNEPIPTRLFPSFAQQGNQGRSLPVVGSYRRLSSGPHNPNWTDLMSHANDAVYNGIHRTQTLILDHLDRDLSDPSAASYQKNATMAAYPNGTLARFYHQGTGDTAALRISILVRGLDAPPAGISSGVVLYQNGVPATDGGQFSSEFPGSITVPVSSDGPDLFEIVGGVYELTGSGAISGTTSEGVGVELFSVTIEELPTIPQQADQVYFYELDTPSLSVGPGATATATITVPTEHGFDVRHLSVKLVITGIADPSDLAVTLSRPDGDEPIILLAGEALPDGWISDDEIGDATPHEPLSDLLPSPSVGDWTISVTNSSGTETAVVHEYAIELR